MCATHRVCIDCDDDEICIMQAVSKSYLENVQINYTFGFLLFPHTCICRVHNGYCTITNCQCGRWMNR